MSYKSKNTKTTIVEAAWGLFYRNGYEHTTIDEIVEASHTSKGSFYHYFRSKADLLGTITILFDDLYEMLTQVMDPKMYPPKKLMYIMNELFIMIENRIPEVLLAEYMALEITSKGSRYFLDPDRTYYRLLRQIFTDGQEKGIFIDNLRKNDMIRAFATFERGVVYDWCLARGNYALSEYGRLMCRSFLAGMLKEEYHYMLD